MRILDKKKCKLFSVFFCNGEYCKHIHLHVDDDIHVSQSKKSAFMPAQQVDMSWRDPPTPMASAVTSTAMSSTDYATVQQGRLAVALLGVSQYMYAYNNNNRYACIGM